MEYLFSELFDAGSVLMNIYLSFFGPIFFAWLDMVILAIATVIVVFAGGWVMDLIEAKAKIRLHKKSEKTSFSVSRNMDKIVLLIPTAVCVLISLIMESTAIDKLVFWPKHPVGIIHVIFFLFVVATIVWKWETKKKKGEEEVAAEAEHTAAVDKIMGSMAAYICEASETVDKSKAYLNFVARCMDRYVDDKTLESMIEKSRDMPRKAESGKLLLRSVLTATEYATENKGKRSLEPDDRKLMDELKKLSWEIIQ